MSNETEETTTEETLPAISDHKAEMVAQFRRIAESMKADNVDDDPEAATEAIIAQIMSAMSVEEILDTAVVGIESLLNVPLYIDRVELRESDFEQGLGAYAFMTCRNDDLERVLVTTGSFAIIAALVKFQAMDAFPVRCMAVRSDKPTKRGYYPLSLSRAPDPKPKGSENGEPIDPDHF